MADAGSGASLPRRLALTAAFLALLGLSWSGLFEREAEATLSPTLERALVTAGLARGLNGVISVAQGTEIAIQPVGVGVTITAGQILDPLNDLVERFSWLALAASASLGAQLLLTEIFSEQAVNWVLTVTVVVYLGLLWWPKPLPALGWLLRLAALVVFVRFLFTVISFSVGWIDRWVLEERQQLAMAELRLATSDIEALEQPDANAPSRTRERSLLERLEDAVGSSQQTFDIEARLNALRNRAEAAIGHLVDLVVLFLVQTLLLPLGAFYLALASFRWFWAVSTSSGPPGS